MEPDHLLDRRPRRSSPILALAGRHFQQPKLAEGRCGLNLHMQADASPAPT